MMSFDKEVKVARVIECAHDLVRVKVVEAGAQFTTWPGCTHLRYQ